MTPPDAVTVLVSTELLEQLGEWSDPVIIKITPIDHHPTGWEMVAMKIPTPAGPELVDEVRIVYRSDAAVESVTWGPTSDPGMVDYAGKLTGQLNDECFDNSHRYELQRRQVMAWQAVPLAAADSGGE